MTIQREHYNGPFIVQCNDCGEAEELEGAGFNSACHDAKERGYFAKLIDNVWHHFCSYCTRANNRD